MSKSYLKTYFRVLLVILLTIGCINFVVDPLWYGKGNQLTGKNPPWNERISKTNLFLQTKQEYNCLILGTSRTTILNSAWLKNHHCFNYSVSGGKLEEIVNYAKYAQEKGMDPVQIYQEIEPDSFNRRSKPRFFDEVTDPMPIFQAYLFSFNTFLLSVRTLVGWYSQARYYNRNFQVELSEDVPRYKPKFSVENEDNKGCDPERTQFFRTLKQTFPNAKFVGFVAPISPWRTYNTRYANGLLNCQLAETYTVAQIFDAIYDFAIPSEVTIDFKNTYDGNHYQSAVFQQIAEVLEERRSDFGLKVNDYSLADYQKLYATQIKAFLEKVGEAERWKG